MIGVRMLPVLRGPALPATGLQWVPGSPGGAGTSLCQDAGALRPHATQVLGAQASCSCPEAVCVCPQEGHISPGLTLSSAPSILEQDRPSTCFFLLTFLFTVFL